MHFFLARGNGEEKNQLNVSWNKVVEINRSDSERKRSCEKKQPLLSFDAKIT